MFVVGSQIWEIMPMHRKINQREKCSTNIPWDKLEISLGKYDQCKRTLKVRSHGADLCGRNGKSAILEEIANLPS